MQQHPIPQNVTQYQFRLVGDMTLKQFLELAGGLLLAYVFYATNLIFIIKWPLAIVSVLGGVGLAFFPLEDRPLDMWIVNFVKAIYAPTRFIWQKSSKVPALFSFTAHAPVVVNTITKTIKAPTLSPNAMPVSDLSDLEAKQVSSVDALFKTLPVTELDPMAAPKIILDPMFVKPTVAVRKLHAPVTTPTTENTKVIKPPVITPPAPAPVVEKHEPLPKNVLFQAPSAPNTAPVAGLDTAKKINLPASPKVPNLVTGVIVDQTGKLVENAIIQIVSADGIPARAMKTNSLGQFYTSTPLSPGTYVIEIDKDGLTFAPQNIIINDTIVSPIELHAST